MTNEEWKELHNILDQIYSDFYFAYSKYKTGKNAKLRDEGWKDVERLIRLFDLNVTKRYEAFELLTGDLESDQARVFIYDEIKQPARFGTELAQFLTKIKTKFPS
ncbi:hypothetical protein WBG78_24845 [Chryseolinea sp. T2]|uniref:hypothetical protein n=1 Tax=Chryseolinea sp. T2 TaxID=3129255 RepID=UPI0030772640